MLQSRYMRFSSFHHNLPSLWNFVTKDRMCEPYYEDNTRGWQMACAGSRRDRSSSSSASLSNFTQAEAWNPPHRHTHAHSHTPGTNTRRHINFEVGTQ